MPLLIDYYLTEKLKLSIGPEISSLGSPKNILNDSTKVNIRDTFNKKWELSGSVGMSYSFDYFVDIGLKYNRAFTKVADYDPLIDRRNLYNNYLQFYFLLKIANN